MDPGQSLIDQAQSELEQVGLDVGEPEQVIHRQDESEQPKAVYTPRFDRIDIYNAAVDEKETQIAIEHELLHLYQHRNYGKQRRGSEPVQNAELQRPSAVGRAEMSPKQKKPAVPQPVESSQQVIETLGEAFAIIYTAYRRDELNEATISSTIDSFNKREDYKGKKIAAMLQELWQRLTALDQEGAERMETFLTTIQDEYLG